MSGSPMPRLITSTPAAFFSLIFRSSSANRYGGRRSSRLLGCIQLLQELLAQRAGVDGPRQAGHVHVHVLPHAALEYARADLGTAGAAPEGHVGPVREQLVSLDPRPVPLEVQLFEAVLDLDRDLRVSHLHELEPELAASRPERARAVVATGRVVAFGVQPRAAHVKRAELPVDARPDLPGGRADREAVTLGPAAP